MKTAAVDRLEKRLSGSIDLEVKKKLSSRSPDQRTIGSVKGENKRIRRRTDR